MTPKEEFEKLMTELCIVSKFSISDKAYEIIMNEIAKKQAEARKESNS